MEEQIDSSSIISTCLPEFINIHFLVMSQTGNRSSALKQIVELSEGYDRYLNSCQIFSRHMLRTDDGGFADILSVSINPLCESLQGSDCEL